MTLTRPVLTAAAAAVFVAILGSATTQIGPWYYGLVKPAWQPPDWLFAPVWTVIYGLTAMAGVLAWKHIADRERRLSLMACSRSTLCSTCCGASCSSRGFCSPGS